MSRGFTIVEALCALAILSLVMVSLYEVGGTTFRTLGMSTSRERAVLLAQSKLDEIASTNLVLPSSSDGSFEGSEARWHVEADDVPHDANSRIYLQAVKLTISQPDLEPLTIETRHLAVHAP